MTVRAIYPGTFDPVTMGHLNITRRAASLFDELIVAVYDAPPKRLMFNTEERVQLYEEALRNIGLRNVRVVDYTGVTVRLARKLDAQVVVRGIRAFDDFLYEADMANTNRTMEPDVEIVFLMTHMEYSYISSSRVKELATLGESIDRLVPPHVAKALLSRLKES